MRTPLQELLSSASRGILSVITHQGEILGFVCNELPESVNHVENDPPRDALNKQTLTAETLRRWADHGAVRITYRGRDRAWFIAPKYQDQMPIAVLE